MSNYKAFLKVAVIFIIILQFYHESFLNFNWKNERNPDKGTLVHEQAIYGLILARGGSKGIKNKNMVNLLGKPLIYWTIAAMLQSRAFEEIWISTDSEMIKSYVLNLGLDLILKVHDRATYTATDEASSIIAVQEFLNYHPNIQTLALIQCTSPLIKSGYVKKAAELMRSNDEIDSVFSVSRHHLLRWSWAPDSHYTTPQNFDPRKRPRRQDWNGELAENGMFYFARRRLLEEGYFQGERSKYVEIPKHDSIEIDSPQDLLIAEILLRRSLHFGHELTRIQDSKK